MLGEFCYWIFNMSIIASVMGLLVLLIRKVKVIPHRVSVFLWVVPFLRMCFRLTYLVSFPVEMSFVPFLYVRFLYGEFVHVYVSDHFFGTREKRRQNRRLS